MMFAIDWEGLEFSVDWWRGDGIWNKLRLSFALFLGIVITFVAWQTDKWFSFLGHVTIQKELFRYNLCFIILDTEAITVVLIVEIEGNNSMEEKLS